MASIHVSNIMINHPTDNRFVLCRTTSVNLGPRVLIRYGEGFLFVFDVNNAESLDKFAECREQRKRAKEKEKVRPEN